MWTKSDAAMRENPNNFENKTAPEAVLTYRSSSIRLLLNSGATWRCIRMQHFVNAATQW